MKPILDSIKYINDNESYGIDYDFKKLEELYKKLEVPEEYWRPPIDKLKYHRYIQVMSDRAAAKTTNVLLLGLCFNRLYGTVIQYVRGKDRQTTQNTAGELIGVINSFEDGWYIRTLTDGRYNALRYHRTTKTFHYAMLDEDGALVEEDPVFCIKMLSVEKHEDYKSGYNAPLGDFILYDEFIQEVYADEFVAFCDLLSTICRKRMSPRIFMLANTINKNSKWFEEYEIAKEIRGLEKGESRSIATEKGTHIYVEVIGNTVTPRKQALNAAYFGFKNPRLAAITGEGTWACVNVQHMPKSGHDGYTYISRGLFLEVALGEYLACDVVEHKEVGVVMYVHRATKVKEGATVLTLYEEHIGQPGYYYGFSNKKIGQFFQKFLRRRKVYYQTNEVGADFRAFCASYKAAPEIL